MHPDDYPTAAELAYDDLIDKIARRFQARMRERRTSDDYQYSSMCAARWLSIMSHSEYLDDALEDL